MINNALKKEAVSSNPALTEVQVIARNDIPAIHSITQDGVVHHLGEVRDFRWHDTLKEFLPSAKQISFSWVSLNPGDSLLPHAHPMKSMIIFVKGSARLTGQINKILKEGDIVITPPNCSHGFDALDEVSFGLSIQFEEGIYTDPENSRVKFLEDEKKLMTTNAHQKIIPDPAKKVCIVSRNEIPPLVDERDGKVSPSRDLRIFHANEALRNILPPSSDFSIAWASLGEGEKVPPHAHDTTTIILIYKGSGRLLVEDGREFSEGDCIVIPPYCEAGFVAGPGGCHGVSIEVGKR